MKERISSFLDGELDQSESEQLISELHEDKSLRAVWTRYNTYGCAMRDELSPALSSDFGTRVIQALAEEPVQLSPAALPRKKRTGPVIGLAVAASLIGIAILIQSPVLQDGTDSQTSKVAAVTVPTIAPVAPESYELIVSNSKNENVRERINRLLVEHNEYNPASDMTGIWTYSRFVGYKSSTDSH